MNINTIRAKLKRVLREEGIVGLIKRTIRYIYLKILYHIRNNRTIYLRKFRLYHNYFNEILNREKYIAVIIFDSRVGWNIPLFQRSQHMAIELSKKGILLFYRTSEQYDREIKDLKRIKDNLYLVNMSYLVVQDALFSSIELIEVPKFLSLYSTDVYLDEEYIRDKYLNRGFKIIYEYIDELSEEITGHLPEFVYKRHEKIIKDYRNCIAAATADKLFEEVVKLRGDLNAALITNGVNYDDWIGEGETPDKIKPILNKGNPIIGYYGAIAKWVDFDLLKYLSEKRPDYEILLIGFLYDGSYKNSGLDNHSNVFYLGVVPYNELKNYAKHFDVSTIPFKLNNITESTNPVKLFEYMALNHPIVTTDLRECRKYKSVIISKTYDDFLVNIDRALSLKKSGDKEYFSLLKSEAIENTWSKKADLLIGLIKKFIESEAKNE